MKVYDSAVITHFPIFQEQVCEIRTPFAVCPFSGEVLFQPVFKHFVGLAGLCPWLFGTDDGAQTHFCVHVFMDRRGAVTVPLAPLVDSHAAVAVHTIVAVVDVPDLLLDFFLSIIISLPVFPVVIVCVRADRQPPQQPADAEFFLMVVNKSISL